MKLLLIQIVFFKDSTCDDGIMNGVEEGIDCGVNAGCTPCPTCDDNLKNGNETQIDCGGMDCPECGKFKIIYKLIQYKYSNSSKHAPFDCK